MAKRVMSVAQGEDSMLIAFSLKSNILLPPEEFVWINSVNHTDNYTKHGPSGLLDHWAKSAVVCIVYKCVIAGVC